MLLWYMGICLFGIQILYMICGMTSRSITCYPQLMNVNEKFVMLSAVMYAFQYIIILMLLFFRLYYVFKQTSFKLSQCTICTFVSLYILLIMLTIGAIFVFTTDFYYESNHWTSFILPTCFIINAFLLGMLA